MKLNEDVSIKSQLVPISIITLGLFCLLFTLEKNELNSSFSFFAFSWFTILISLLIQFSSSWWLSTKFAWGQFRFKNLITILAISHLLMFPTMGYFMLINRYVKKPYPFTSPDKNRIFKLTSISDNKAHFFKVESTNLFNFSVNITEPCGKKLLNEENSLFLYPVSIGFFGFEYIKGDIQCEKLSKIKVEPVK